MQIKTNRIEFIDLLKGRVMIIMAINHTRDYFHYSAFFFDPTDSTRTRFSIFFTRFITHFCAPTFCFLAGTSAYMVGRRKSKNELSSFLLKGRVPFFYYILHLYLILLIALLFTELSDFGWPIMILSDWVTETPTIKGFGIPLWVVYSIGFPLFYYFIHCAKTSIPINNLTGKNGG